MGTLLIIGLVVIIATVFVWYLEMRSFLRHMIVIDGDASLFTHAVVAIKNTVLFFKYGTALILDVLITLFIAGSLGLATGLFGAVLALILSLGISLIILRAGRKRG